jgi:hypothetical protein
MTGSMLSQPPILTPLMGILPYSQDLSSAGTLAFAWVESSQVSLSPIMESPPTVAEVYVTLKSVVSYQVKGSKTVPCASLGMSDCEMPSKFLLEGEFDEGDVLLAVFAGVDDLCLLDKTTPTGMTIASMSISIMPMMPYNIVSNESHAPSNKTHQSSSASASALRLPQTRHYQHHLVVLLFDRQAQPSHHKAQRHVRGKSH